MKVKRVLTGLLAALLLATVSAAIPAKIASAVSTTVDLHYSVDSYESLKSLLEQTTSFPAYERPVCIKLEKNIVVKNLKKGQEITIAIENRNAILDLNGHNLIVTSNSSEVPALFQIDQNADVAFIDSTNTLGSIVFNSVNPNASVVQINSGDVNFTNYNAIMTLGENVNYRSVSAKTGSNAVVSAPGGAASVRLLGGQLINHMERGSAFQFVPKENDSFFGSLIIAGNVLFSCDNVKSNATLLLTTGKMARIQMGACYLTNSGEAPLAEDTTKQEYTCENCKKVFDELSDTCPNCKAKNSFISHRITLDQWFITNSLETYQNEVQDVIVNDTSIWKNILNQKVTDLGTGAAKVLVKDTCGEGWDWDGSIEAGHITVCAGCGAYQTNLTPHHFSNLVTPTKPNCIIPGITAGKICDYDVGDHICGYIIEYPEEIPTTNQHTYRFVKYTETPTFTTSGKKLYRCNATGTTNGGTITCGKTKIKTVAATKNRLSTLRLSKTQYTYNGKVKTPAVVIQDKNGKSLVKGKHYTVSYAKGRKNVGEYQVTIKFKGGYHGKTSLKFQVFPKKAAITNLNAEKRTIIAAWKSQTAQVAGYQLQYATDSTFKNAQTVTITKNTTSSTAIRGLKSNQKYYVRMRTYQTTATKKNFASGWSTVKTITTK